MQSRISALLRATAIGERRIGSACAAKPTFNMTPIPERDADYVQPLPTLAFPPIFPPGPAGAGYRHCRWRVAGTAGSKRSPRSR